MIKHLRLPDIGARMRSALVERQRWDAFVRQPKVRLALRAALVVVACVYYATGLSVREVSLLESQDFGIACDLFENYALSPDHSPLHFVFVNLWQRLNSNSVAFLRAPSVIFCSIGVLLVFCLAEAIAGTLAGLLAAAFMIFNPDVVDVARSMRLYSLVVLSSSMCLWFAYAYLVGSRRKQDLLGFAASVLIAVYTHLFTWLLVGSLGLLFLIDIARHRGDAEARRGLRWLGVTLLLLLPQIAHSFVTVAFVRERHGLYSGLPSNPLGFLTPIARTLCFGESESSLPLPNYVLLIPAVLIALGVASLAKRGALVVAASVAPALFGAWRLSRSSPVEPRYLCFLLPLLAILMGIGAVRAPKAYALAPLSLTSIWLFHFASQAPYAVGTDWYDAARKLENLAGSTDVVAVFPGYWAATFRRYTKIQDIAPITFPVDMEHVLARGKRILLVRNSGRYFGNLDALLSKETSYQPLFSSVIRDPIVVYTVTNKKRPPAAPRASPESLLVTGTFGSGGFPWQANADASPFRKLKALLAGSRRVLTAYEPYHPPWYARIFLGGEEARSFEPNSQTIYQLSRAGITDAVLTCHEARCEADADLLAANGITVIARDAPGEAVKPTVFQLGGVAVGVLGITEESLAEGPPDVPLQLLASIRRARGSVGESGRLIALIPAASDYGRLATARERRVAQRLVDSGVDVVIGEGGYAAKEIEEYRRGIIAYSLGTLLRPPALSLALRESTGLALRLSFPVDDKPHYEAIPLTFDDTSTLALADPAASRRLRPPRADRVSTSLVERLTDAEASYRSADGVERRISVFRAEGSCLPPLEQWLYAEGAPLTRWFPDTPPSTPLRPAAGAFCADAAYVARRGVLSLGEYRRAFELETGGQAAVRVHFKRVHLGTELRLAYAIPDDRLLSKFLPLRDETVVVQLAGRGVFSQPLGYRAGWQEVTIDTSAFSHTDQDMDISIETSGTHFPIAFAAEISGDAQ
jgi:4-amino-4-deoxy-L-arabinose transferase-like glycosyltransferase